MTLKEVSEKLKVSEKKLDEMLVYSFQVWSRVLLINECP